jgi:hypothetical protein
MFPPLSQSLRRQAPRRGIPFPYIIPRRVKLRNDEFFAGRGLFHDDFEEFAFADFDNVFAVRQFHVLRGGMFSASL